MKKDIKQKTKIIHKKIEVDIGVEYIIRWLNKLPHVQTLFCCEGGGKDHSCEGYVSFICVKDEILIKIIEVLNGKLKNRSAAGQYSIYWEPKETKRLNKFCRKLLRNEKEKTNELR